MILDRRVGDIPVLRRYIGDQLVWEREEPVEKLWEAFVNFGLAGKTSDDLSGWNNVKATSGQVTSGATFTGIKNTDGEDTPIEIQVGPANLFQRTETIHDPAVNQNVYKTSYDFPAPGGSFKITGLNDSRRYRITIFGGCFAGASSYVVIYTKCVLNGVELPIQQDHDVDENPDTTLYYIRAIDVQPVDGELEFEFFTNTDIPVGFDLSFSLSGLRIEEYSVSTGWQYPIELVPKGAALDFPYAIRVPGVVNPDTPLVVSTPTGGSEGIGSGSLDHINWIFTETLVKPLINGNPTVPSDPIIVCPQYLSNDWNQGHLADLIDHIVDEYGLNGEHIYLMGFSGGLEVALAYIGEKHRQVRAAVLGSSRYTYADYAPGTAPDYAQIASTNTPIWLFGSNNDPVVPFASFIDIRDKILAEDPNYPLKVTVYNDNTHYWPMIYVYSSGVVGLPPRTIVPGYEPYTPGEHWSWMFSV